MRNRQFKSTPPNKTSRMAIASLTLAIVGWCVFIIPPLAVFLGRDAAKLGHPLFSNLVFLLSMAVGLAALVIIKTRHLKGSPFAISGIALSSFPFVFGILLIWVMFPGEVTEVSKYEQIRHKLSHDPTLIAHFPQAIPGAAEDVHLSYFPGCLQGGAWFQIRMTLPEDRISQLLQQFDVRQIKSFQGGGWRDHANAEGGMPTTSLRTSDSDSRVSSGNDVQGDFPQDFVVMVLDASGNCNHGESYGVAISKAKNQIVYWAEDW
jgi:hypothetical protein